MSEDHIGVQIYGVLYVKFEDAKKLREGWDKADAEIEKLRAELQTARRDALEEAAKWHDEEVEYFAKMGREVSPRDVTIGGMHHMEAGRHRNCAAAIRALKGEGDE